jgi:hypothetical protein
MAIIYFLIFTAFMYLVYDAFYVRKHFEQIFYMTLVSITCALFPLLYYFGPNVFLPLYGFAHGAFIQDTLGGKFIINRNNSTWTTDAKCLLHGSVSFVRYCVIGYCANMVLHDSYINTSFQEFVDKLVTFQVCEMEM